MSDLFIRTLFDAITTGFLYSLIAVGYTMVYGIIKLINFAHGEVFMIGAFFGLMVVNMTAAFLGGFSILLAVPVAMFGCAVLGFTMDIIAYKPLRGATRLAALITAIGVSLSLQTIVQLFTPEYHHFPAAHLPEFFDKAALQVQQVSLLWKELSVWVAAATLMVGLDLLVNWTKTGKAMRACALDKSTAALMGINVNRVIATTFMIGSAMAAVAGILQGIKVGGNINFRFGYYPGLIAFAAAVLGGIGSIRGAFLGGLVIGFTQVFMQTYVNISYGFSFAFGVMILTIIVRPVGILGRPEAKRA